MANNPRITGHMVVKNEDRWVYFAVKSILPYVDKLLITDTGSTDNTLAILQGIRSDKIELNQTIANTPAEVTAVRQRQLDATKTDWLWVIDGDEIYTNNLCEEIVAAISKPQTDLILVRRYDLLGDIYHRQEESVGSYELFGYKGHILTRLVKKSAFPKLRYQGKYPNEGYYLADGQSIRTIEITRVYATTNSLYHAMYLQRSSDGANLTQMLNRSKYKIEKGISINSKVPEIFTLTTTYFGSNPLQKRTFLYEIMASIITPIKKLKRKYL